MSTTLERTESLPAATPLSEIDRALSDLQQGARRLIGSSVDERIQWARQCIDCTTRIAGEWVGEAVAAKQIPPGSSAVAEEILAGPTSVLRYLQLMIRTLEDLKTHGAPKLSRPPRTVQGQVRVTTFPTRALSDALVFPTIQAETWLDPQVSASSIFGDSPAKLLRQTPVNSRIALVLGAGNVAAIPATDALTMIFQNDSAVLLKMNPVNDYLGPIFEQCLKPLIQAGFLRIVFGGAEQGRYGVHHSSVDSVHITGSTASHDAVVWGGDPDEQERRKRLGEPLVAKPVTSELGNVTPWIIVPGDYTEAQLTAQAENIAASITNNASFNCIATKMLITCAQWPQRERFLDRLSAVLARTPARYAYYPGAVDRFERFTDGAPGPDKQGRLPWTLRRGVALESEPLLFEQESFVCVTGETALDAANPREFLDQAVDFANERLWGTLAAALTVPNSMNRRNSADLESALARLRYGTIGVNLWPGVGYALMSTPWGGYPETSLEAVGSGIGFVHNTFLLDRPQKSILRAPLTMFPKPVWFSTNRRAEAISWKLAELYGRPSVFNFLKLIGVALRG